MPDFNKIVQPKERNFLRKIVVTVCTLAGILLIAFLIGLGVLDRNQVKQSRTDERVASVEDYACREIHSTDAPIGVKKEYTFTISDNLSIDTHLAFYTVHQYVDVYLDGENVYNLKPSKGKRISKTVGSNWVMIPLYREDAGKEIRVVITPVYESFKNREVEFLIGSELGIYTKRLFLDLPQLILGLLAIFVGIVFVGLSVYNRFLMHHGNRIGFLGMFSIMMGIWRVMDTRFTPYLFPDHAVQVFYLSVTMLMLGIIPLMKYIETGFHKCSRRMFDVYSIVIALLCMGQLFLQIFGVMDLRDNLLLTHVCIVVGAANIIGNVVYERLKYPENHKNRMERFLPLICVVGVLADVVSFYVKGTSSGLVFSLSAFLVYILCSGIHQMLQYSEQEKQLAEKDKLLAENERRLTESRISTMISQIQPHFIYNTLGTVGQLCLEEPEKAAQLVKDFSLYLRGNFTELDNPALIRISKEMEHVKHYVNIEQIRFPDMEIIYDLKADEFLLPALTIQPLVENAIKHGLMGLETGGTVKISTYETDKTYCVCVEDDGVGFDKAQVIDERKHVGIKNIRGRIEAMCNGTLTIESTPGIGTTAYITIPKEGAEFDSNHSR